MFVSDELADDMFLGEGGGGVPTISSTCFSQVEVYSLSLRL